VTVRDPRPPRSLRARAFIGALKLGWIVFVILTPLLGAWFSSSIAAYANGPTWLAASIGLLLFPGLPLAWEGFARYREKKRGVTRRFLTFGDRLLLRTLGINLLFLGVLLAARPEAGVRAVSARGDWMLDGHDGAFARPVRRGLLRCADGFDWLYRLAYDSPFDGTGDGTGDGGGEVRDDKRRKPDKPDHPPMPRGDVMRKTDDGGKPAVDAPPDPTPEPAYDAQKPWPSAAKLHPKATTVPKEAEASIATLAAWFVAQEADPLQRFKLIHDWVADRIAYDVPSLDAHTYMTKQQALTVLQSRVGVCAGYAQLLLELGKAAGYDVEYVTGVAKGAGGEVDGAGHAWNTVKIGGTRYLVDATWDAGSVGDDGKTGRGFHKAYSTEYLFAPPDVFGVDHYPDDAKHQLRDKPITRGEFMRLPQMRPRFFAQRWKLLTPDRSQITVRDSVEVTLENGGKRFLLADVVPAKGGAMVPCEVREPQAGNGDTTMHVTCKVPVRGDYRLLLFDAGTRYTTYQSMGELSVLANP